VIVAASPPTEAVAVATRPLTKQDLIDYLASGCKTKDKWRYLLIFFHLLTHVMYFS
jgi:glutamate--cysteine ligase